MMRAWRNQQATLYARSRATESDDSARIVPGFTSGGMTERGRPKAAESVPTGLGPAAHGART